MSDIDPIEFGRLQSEVATLRRDNDRQLVLLEQLAKDVGAMKEQMVEARGGWKLLMLLGGSAASLGGAISWAAAHIKWGGP